MTRCFTELCSDDLIKELLQLLIERIPDQECRNILDKHADEQNGNFPSLPLILRILGDVNELMQKSLELFGFFFKSCNFRINLLLDSLAFAFLFLV